MKMKEIKYEFYLLLFLLTVLSANAQNLKTPVDYVNPFMGNISHLLVPTFPTVHLPNSMLRVYPERCDFTSELIYGLPIAVTSHRGSSAFRLSPFQGDQKYIKNIIPFTYGLEKIKPYRYSVCLDQAAILVDFAPSHQSAVYELTFEKEGENKVILNVDNGELKATADGLEGYQIIDNTKTKIYIYLESKVKPQAIGALAGNKIDYSITTASGNNKALVMSFKNEKKILLRYGISFISTDQAKNNLHREINNYNIDELAKKGYELWNKTLSKIQIAGGSENDKTIFYTSLYRTYERMINISEDGKYYSSMDGKVHDDEGSRFFTDDWIWDTYRATHPLRILIEPKMEQEMIVSYIRMAQQSAEGWLPTFPEITGDTHRMNGNHGVSVIWDAYSKGLTGFKLDDAFIACKGAMTEKSLLPWMKVKANELDKIYNEKGFFPALKLDEDETCTDVNPFEKRQPVAVTLGACYDDWCLSQIAKQLNKKEDYEFFLHRSNNYRNLFNSETTFFHPKDKEGNFIQPFDYRYSGGIGGRLFYGENNGWIYRWDVQHNFGDLVKLMGGPQKFVDNLNATFREPLGMGKYEFFNKFPDHTGNVGQFSMANEPSFHIPYLYNYAGQPWETQKHVRRMLKLWFRNDLMGVPGDEDGGGMSAFVLFSAMGFYPVTPGTASYNIGSPLFSSVKMDLGNGKFFEITALKCSDDNKYIQSATLNGKAWNKPWFSHSDIANGGKLVLVMGNKANKNWGSDLANVPPSAEEK